VRPKVVSESAEDDEVVPEEEAVEVDEPPKISSSPGAIK
jgi:hypothetical protein